MGNANVTLYAVFRQTITLSYNANGGSSTPAAQTGYRYYNNGNMYTTIKKLNGLTSDTIYAGQKLRVK